VSATRQAVFWLVALAVVFLLLRELSGILLPFVAGFGIAYLLSPLVTFQTRWRVPRELASLLALLLFLLALVAIIVLIVPVIEVQAAQLVHAAPIVAAYLRDEAQRLLDLAQRQLPPEDMQKAHDAIGSWTGSALAWAGGLVEGLLTSGLAIANLFTLLLITPLVAFFLLRDWPKIGKKLDDMLPRPYAPTIRQQAHLVNQTIAGYLHGQALVSLMVGVYYAVTLSIVGLNFAIILSLVIAILSFVPYVGEAPGVLMAVGLAAVQFGTWGKIIAIAVIFLVGHLAAADVLQPKLIGSRVHLHQVWVIFALLAFGELFGFLGILLALPAAAVIGVLVRFALARYLASPLYDPSRHRPFDEG
jgi:predicted PurR-regulated permease PerM